MNHGGVKGQYVRSLRVQPFTQRHSDILEYWEQNQQPFIWEKTRILMIRGCSPHHSLLHRLQTNRTLKTQKQALTRHEDDEQLSLLSQQMLEEADGRSGILHIVQHLWGFHR